jgi:hypothetical protein
MTSTNHVAALVERLRSDAAFNEDIGRVRAQQPERTRAAADLIATQAATIAALQAEVERAKEELRKLKKPEFFWDYDNPWCCYDSWSDALDEPDLGSVVHLLTGISLPEVWVTTRVLTVDEDGDPDETEPALFHSEAEAAACYPASLDAARSASRKENAP